MEHTQPSSVRHTLVFLKDSKTQEKGPQGSPGESPPSAPFLSTKPPGFVFKSGLRREGQAGQVSAK